MIREDMNRSVEMSSEGIVHSVWRNRVVLLSAFGLVGVGAVIGAGSVYLFYIRNKLQDLFQIQSTLSSQVQHLKKEVDKVNQTLTTPNGTPGGSSTAVRKSSILRGPSKRTVRFRDGYETADEDEYVTASSDSDLEVDAYLSNVASNTDNAEYSQEDDWVVGFLKNIDTFLDGDAASQHEAFIRLQSYKDKMGDSCEFWWRFAKATHMEATAAKQAGDSAMQKSLVFAGHTRAERALQLNENSANAHKWYAITLGSKGEFVSVNDKIKNGFTFKEHIDKAVQITPQDPSLHYLLGRFCYEVTTLSWVERRIASTLFSAPPNSSPQEALQHFQASERLGKPLKDNRLYMAKCYIVLKNNEEAASWLKKAVEMPNVSSSDKPIHDEALKLLAKYKQYLT
ncbi:Regulator of microtubule dynamics protein 2 [Orchesella cincta]|uniref:Regulator of microtubule dynamics protein 2 n=1 Tax=Orchesella cincta TaxID=48709 RepID=A0A1D2MUZ4_ORCCI|nr:Regulator of microtubule dynamics protein 2 [Orchesella cincta]